jgi:hypothetical protein
LPLALQKLRPGLLRWTTPHPEWDGDAEPESPADWPEEVGSVAYEARDAFVLVDPLVPQDGWEELDERVRRHGRRVAVLTTIQWHRRSRDEWWRATARRPRAPGGRSPAVSRRSPSGALVRRCSGSRSTGRSCPATGSWARPAAVSCSVPKSWLRYLPSGMSRDELRAALAPLLDLPVEQVLVSHGEPVLENGREELVRAFADE